MREWTKPELYVEDFELSQHVAAGCGTQTEIVVKPGEWIQVVIGCASSYSGTGHWHKDVKVYDDNGNGKIDWDEFTKYAEVADNGNVTGSGHRNHGKSVYIPGHEEIVITEKPFTS